MKDWKKKSLITVSILAAIILFWWALHFSVEFMGPFNEGDSEKYGKPMQWGEAECYDACDGKYFYQRGSCGMLACSTTVCTCGGTK